MNNENIEVNNILKDLRFKFFKSKSIEEKALYEIGIAIVSTLKAYHEPKKKSIKR